MNKCFMKHKLARIDHYKIFSKFPNPLHNVIYLHDTGRDTLYVKFYNNIFGKIVDILFFNFKEINSEKSHQTYYGNSNQEHEEIITEFLLESWMDGCVWANTTQG